MGSIIPKGKVHESEQLSDFNTYCQDYNHIKVFESEKWYTSLCIFFFLKQKSAWVWFYPLTMAMYADNNRGLYLLHQYTSSIWDGHWWIFRYFCKRMIGSIFIIEMLSTWKSKKNTFDFGIRNDVFISSFLFKIYRLWF